MSQQTERKVWPPKERPIGLVCPKCGCADLRVLNTRQSLGQILRYRQCRHCGCRVATYEVTPAMLGNSNV